jgi:peptide/nickel transport system substrate-binding protein
MRREIAKAVLVLAIGALALVAAGCGGGSGGSGSGGSSGGTASAPKPGGTLQAAMAADVTSLNPAETFENSAIRALSQIIEPLFKADPEGKIEPWLAAGLETSADQLTTTVHLKPGVRFSDGRPLTAKDVVFSLEIVRKSPSWSFLFELVSSIKASSPSTVVITTKKPMPALEATLSHFATGIIPADYGGASKKAFDEEPIGTGPFAVSTWVKGKALTLVRNPHYWQKGRPYADKLVFNNVPEDTSRESQLRSGQLDIVEGPTWAQIPEVESNPELHLETFAEGLTNSLVVNTKVAPFDDPLVREAIDLAIDREAIVKAALGGHGKPAGSWFSPALEFYDTKLKPPVQDLAKAKRLIAEAKQSTTFDGTFSLLIQTGVTSNRTEAQIIQQDLEEIGLKVELEPLDESAFVAQFSSGKYDTMILPFTADIIDPTEQTAFYIAYEGLFSGADTSKVEELAAKANVETDEASRRDLYYEIQQLISDQHAVIPLDYQPFVWSMGSSVTGFEVEPVGIPWFGNAGFTG